MGTFDMPLAELQGWSYRKCDCGHDMCQSYFLNFTSSDRRVTLEQAKLIVEAPDLKAKVNDLLSRLDAAIIVPPRELINYIEGVTKGTIHEHSPHTQDILAKLKKQSDAPTN